MCASSLTSLAPSRGVTSWDGFGSQHLPRVQLEATGVCDEVQEGWAGRDLVWRPNVRAETFLGEALVLVQVVIQRSSKCPFSVHGWTHTHTHTPLQPHQGPARQIQQKMNLWRVDLQAPPRAPSGATLPSLIPLAAKHMLFIGMSINKQQQEPGKK